VQYFEIRFHPTNAFYWYMGMDKHIEQEIEFEKSYFFSFAS
jgi:hypothetical protein